MKLIGIGGTDGSGKDSLGEILANNFGWKFISVTESLRDELKRRELPVTRTNQRMVSAEWRRKFGRSVLIDKALEAYKHDNNKYKGLVLASLRNPGEPDRIHELNGIVVWIDADPKIRYQRITKRNRGGFEDKVTYDEFLAEERAQFDHGEDHHTLSLSGVKAKADIYIENNGDDIAAFKTQAERALASVI